MTEKEKPQTRQELIELIQEMINVYEKLPRDALFAPVTHEDHHSLLLLLLSLFKAE